MIARRVRSILLVCLALLPAMLLLAPSPGSGQSAGTGGDVTAPALHLRSVTNWVGPVGTFRAEVIAQHLPAGARITFSMHQAMRDRVTLDRSVSGAGSGPTLLRGNVELPAGEEPKIVVDFPISDTWPTPEGGVVLDGPGVHPVVIEATDADGTRLATIVTQLIRLPAATTTTPPLAVGVIVEQRQSQSIALDGRPYLDEPAARRLADGLRVLAEFPALPFTTLPVASTLVDATESGSAFDSTLLGAVRASATHQLLATTYAPIALGSWSDAGLTNELDSQYSAGRTTIAGLVGTAPDRSIAVLDPTIGASGLDIVADQGADAVIVPSDQLVGDPSTTPAPTRGFDVRSADGRRLHALAADTAISTGLLAESDPAAIAQRALAELSILSITNRIPAQGLAVIVPGATTPAALEALLSALAVRDGSTAGDPGAPLVSPVRLDDLFTVTDVTTSYDNAGALVPTIRTITSVEPESLGDYPDALRSTRRSIDALVATVPETPSLASGAVHRSLASGDRTLSDQDRSTVLASARFAIRSVTDEIVMAPEQIVTLTSRSGKVPLSIENRLQVPAHVRVRLRSAKLDFPDGAEFDQILAPGTTTRIDARVTTRASGAFPLEVVVTSPDAVLSVTGARFTVRSTAISGIGLLISLAAGVFLALWWIRHHRTARRASRLIGTGHPTTDGASSPSAPDEYARPSDSNLGDQ